MIPPRIFISYRRDDTGPIAHLLREQLLGGMPPSEHREAAVFLDVRSIDYGREFPLDLAFAIEHCRIFVVLIGSKWLDELELRQMEKKFDWVEQEIEMAIKFGKYIVPVWVNCPVEKQPNAENLPPSIVGLSLARRNAKSVECGRKWFRGPTLDPTLYPELLRLEAMHAPPGIEATMAVHAVDDEMLMAEVKAINESLAAAMVQDHEDQRRKAVAETVVRACHFVDRRSGSFRELLRLLRDYPARQTEVVRAFLGDPSRLGEFLLSMQQAVGQFGKQDLETEQGFQTLLLDITRVLERPSIIDELTRSWEKLRALVCDRGAFLNLSANRLSAAEHATACSRAAACCSLLSHTMTSELSSRAVSAEPDLAQLALGAVAASTFHLAVAAFDESESAHWMSQPPAPRHYWDEANRAIDTMDALRNTTGSSAEAEHTRRRLAENLADEILKEAALPRSETETAPIRSSLALLFGDSRPDWDFAPKWAREDHESLLRNIEMIFRESTAVEDIVRDLENFSGPIGLDVAIEDSDTQRLEDDSEAAW